MTFVQKCWCGNSKLIAFSYNYMKCANCETLISVKSNDDISFRIKDDDHDFYGREYWFSHVTEIYGTPDIEVRARTDLPERCIYWLASILENKLPPGKVLELGSAHGGFVALMKMAGFDSMGLELSPWIAAYSRKIFDIPVLLGPIEDQKIAFTSIDAIILMDVLEHLPDPLTTMMHCINLLKPNGIIVIQTPRLPEGKDYTTLKQNEDPFLLHLKEKEHLYLFSQNSIKRFFQRVGASYCIFKPAIFDKYDMFLVVSRLPIISNKPNEIEETLCQHPSGRIVLSLLDAHKHYSDLIERFKDAEKDRAARLRQIEELTQTLKESEKDRAARLKQIEELTQILLESEDDRAARLEIIHKSQKIIDKLETDKLSQLSKIQELTILVESLKNHLQSVTNEYDRLNQYPEIRLRNKFSILAKYLRQS